MRIARLGEGGGLVTGYYEPIVAGSRFPSPEFSVPIYRRPRDLVADGYKQGSTAFPNKGGRIGRRTDGNDLVPYHDRGAIEAGALDGQKLEICWIKDPLDLVAIQIEGSARVILEDGTPLRISYDSHNGYSYNSIERALVERNLMSRPEMSRERIRAWMLAHPEEAAKVRAVNRAYMFFRVTGLTNDGEPVGAQGVPLTPGRSIAVDRVHEYGTPFFIEGNLPVESAKPAAPFGRLTIAQDTGSAIVGPARADLYLGAGDEAGRIAGRIKHRGRFSMLVPRELDLAAAASELPLPVPKPNTAEDDGGKADTKPDGKGKAEPAAGSPAPAPGKPVPSPVAKTKIAVLDVGKAERERKAQPAGAATDGRRTPALAPKTKVAVAEGKKPDHKGKMDSDSAAWTVAGKQKPSSAAKTKIAETDVQETRRQGQSRARRVRCDRQAIIGSEDEDRRGRSQERNRQARRQGQGGVRRFRQDRRQAAVVGVEVEKRRGRLQEAKRQGQSGVRQLQSGCESGGEAGPASRLRAQERPLSKLIVAAGHAPSAAEWRICGQNSNKPVNCGRP